MAKNFINQSVLVNERNNNTMTIVNKDGKVETITYGEWKKRMQAKKKAEQSAKPTRKIDLRSDIQLLPSHIKRIVANIKTIKSLSAYYDHAYRQWGNIAKEHVIEHPMISHDFVLFRAKAKEMAELQDRIAEYGKKNEKDVFQIIEKLAYKVDDLTALMISLAHSVEESHVCDTFKDKEFINGQGRRLGLSILMTRTLLSLNDMEKLFKELQTLSNGITDIVYASNGKRVC